jgi:hypothetical protein
VILLSGFQHIAQRIEFFKQPLAADLASILEIFKYKALLELSSDVRFPAKLKCPL